MKRLIRERNAALESGDMAWLRKQLPPLTSARVAEITFHKARLACAAVSDAKRAESALWLKQRGYGALGEIGQVSCHDH